MRKKERGQVLFLFAPSLFPFLNPFSDESKEAGKKIQRSVPENASRQELKKHEEEKEKREEGKRGEGRKEWKMGEEWWVFQHFVGERRKSCEHSLKNSSFSLGD
eukprot:CAMPEP_0201506322 /NCGR_PEP_ID=MMETSP0161_2-20130828/247_1 /ASSEMBLY_ACC=CAM_ASM_000251 /TAXON_ID=180227 /ORGANISM="Neoparamoeba aestuarina, Strain SoJaBio B1-5/56/2" /LENGTH=103 /DNA_ID=CAMNT_0047900381 /DNA_START=165 /DNA_END=476 /DNA_ORIENTATION=-